MGLRYGSVCSGIEAASVAWKPLGWEAEFFSEIDRFPCEVLANHYGSNLPGDDWARNGVPNYGDMTKFQEWPDHAIDLLVGGTPCQSFSVAGLRAGLADPRGNLMLTYLAIAARYRPRWLVWENVPGVLSSGDGRDFGTFLQGLGELGYGFAYRVLDAQYVRVGGFERAVPQRRRRVFVVGYLGDWRRAAAVLFDAPSLRGDSAPRREAGQGVAGTIDAGTHPGSYSGQEVAHALRGEGFDASEDGTGRGTPIVATIAQTLTRGAESAGKGGYAGRRQEDDTNLVAFNPQAGGKQTSLGYDPSAGIAGTLEVNQVPAVAASWAVRRLTPTECERLQGFPDGYTAIQRGSKLAADGPRYKALGNSMAVNAMRWIGERVAMVDAIPLAKDEAA